MAACGHVTFVGTLSEDTRELLNRHFPGQEIRELTDMSYHGAAGEIGNAACYGQPVVLSDVNVITERQLAMLRMDVSAYKVDVLAVETHDGQLRLCRVAGYELVLLDPPTGQIAA